MLLRMNEHLSIDNLKDYPTEIVDQLEKLLASGAAARPDPRRKNFYDVEDAGRVFFVHASPVSGKVMLLATWLCELPELTLEHRM